MSPAEPLREALRRAVAENVATPERFGLDDPREQAALALIDQVVDVAADAIKGEDVDQELEVLRVRAKQLQVVPSVGFDVVLRQACGVYFAKLGAGLFPAD